MRAVFAIVALISQIVLGSLVIPDRAAARPMDALHAALVLCRSGSPVTDAPPHHRPQHPVRDASCPLDVALELPAVILTPAIIVPSARLPTGRRIIALPPARAPPTTMIWTLRARGPPNLV